MTTLVQRAEAHVDQRSLLAMLPIALAALGAATLAFEGHRWAASGLALAVAVAIGVVLHVDLPWGGRLTLGHSLLVAIVAGIDPMWALAVAVGGIALSLPTWLDHTEEGPLLVRLGGAASVLIATIAAVAMHMALDAVDAELGTGDSRIILVTTIVGVAFLVVDDLIRALVARRSGERSDLRQAWPLYVTLLCVAILIELAARRSLGLAFIAIVPMLVTRFSFQRYTSARVTYEQTTRALSLLPEVAGLSPLGHSERTAAYVEAVGPTMGMDPTKVSQLVNAARLHNIGHISLHEETEREAPPDPAELADVSEEILRQTGFLADLIDLVKDSQPGGPPASTLEAAVIRVCATLDDIVESEMSFDPFATLVAVHPVGHERTVAIALLALSNKRPGLIAEARASVELIHQVAANAASADHHH